MPASAAVAELWPKVNCLTVVPPTIAAIHPKALGRDDERFLRLCRTFCNCHGTLASWGVAGFDRAASPTLYSGEKG